MKFSYFWTFIGLIIFCTLVHWSYKSKLQELDNKIYYTNLQIKQLTELVNNQQELLGNLDSSLTTLDEAIHIDSKRRVKINKVRGFISRLLKEINTEATRRITPIQISEISTAIVDYGNQYNVPNSLIIAVIRQESNFDIKAVSSAGAKGLIQILPSTAEDIKVWLNKPYYDAFKPSQNIQFGVYYLGKLLNMFPKDISKAVMAYNTGPGNVIRFQAGEIQLYPETINYEEKVINYYQQYKNLGID